MMIKTSNVWVIIDKNNYLFLKLQQGTKWRFVSEVRDASFFDLESDAGMWVEQVLKPQLKALGQNEWFAIRRVHIELVP